MTALVLSIAALAVTVGLATLARAVRYGLADIADAIANDDTSSELNEAGENIAAGLSELADILRELQAIHAEQADAR